ncbi:MAG: helix-turn-helix domain-containing protein [Eubacteriales bacterium]|nr:helix-turn-helix domain-containing protein [Eubacteriales bacterium]
MNYQSGYLFYELSKYYIGNAVSSSYQDHYGRPLFFESGKNYFNQLILTDKEHYQECLCNCHACAIIINGSVQPALSDNHIYIIQDEEPVHLLFNRITDICNRFDQWDENLSRIVADTLTYDDLYQATDSMMSQGFSLFDTNFRFVSLSKRIIREEELLSYIVSINKEGHQIMPIDNLLTYAQSTEFLENEKSDKPFLSRVPRPCYNINLFFKKKRIGMMSLAATEDSLENDHNCALLLHLASYVKKLYSYYQGFFVIKSEHKEKENYLKTLIQGKTPTDSYWYDRARINRYAFYLLTQTKDSTQNLYIIYLCNYLETLIPQSFCFEYNNQIAVLLEYPGNVRGEIEDKLRQFLLDKHLMAATTRDFQDLSYLAAAYRQASITLKLSAKDISATIRSFYDYAFRYIMDCSLTHFTPDEICAPAIQTLLEYDAVHQTELAKTLETYLTTHLNATKSARQLYVHRSSFLSRLDRIIQLTNLNLEDQETRLYLEISFAIKNLYQLSD